jgi:ribosomal protein S18 acetylase RimI-like enzyme
VQVRSLGYQTDLMLRRLAGASVDDRGDHLVVRTPDNPAFYWGNFLLLERPPAFGQAVQWLDVFADAFPEAQHVAIGVDGTDGDTGDITAFCDAGLEVEINVVLSASDLHGGPPAGVDVRPLTTDADWQQAVDVRVAAYDDNVSNHREFVERKFAEARGLVAAGHGRYFGAFLDGSVRSSLGIFTGRNHVARYQNVETHPDYRRRGLARALLLAAATAARAELAAETLVIVAEPDYFAIDLYRAVGFTDSERQVQLQRAAPAIRPVAAPRRG